MKKALKISVSILLLALAFAVTQIPAEPVEADSASVSNDADFQMNGTVLVKYTGTAKTVSVPASVTEIGAEAFADNTTMETLNFKGERVESIGYHAFAGCTGLKEVQIPDSVQEIGNGAFSNCTSLGKAEFGKSMHNLGIGVFAGCSALNQITVSKENVYFTVDDDCLYDAEKSKLYLVLPGREKDNYTMPATVTDIAEYAFWGNPNIKSISLSSNLKQIPDYAFSNCKGLTGITIPYSVSSIGIKAFSDCVNLETVVIPSVVASIHDTAFDGCVKLKISAEEGTAAYKYYQVWKNRNQAEYEDTGNAGDEPSEVTPGENAGNADSGDEDGTLMGSTYVVGNHAVVFIDNTSPNVYGDDSGSTAGPDALVNDVLSKGTEIPKYTVAFDSILSDQAYYRSHDMTGYRMPDGITEIGEFSFARSNLSEAVIPDGVTTIGYGAFYHCDYLAKVKIPSSVTYIAPKAFAESMWLNNWLAGNGSDEYLIVGNGILLAYRGEGGNLTLPDTVKRIAPEAFAGNPTILSVNLPDSVIEIGEDAFLDCKNLYTVSGGKNVKVIRDRAFKGCPLASAHVWEKVEYLGLMCFDFADTSFGSSNKVVVFDGKESLPKPCYEETAGRLSNEQARGMILGDATFAIVPKGVKPEMLSDTVLASDVYGFKGIIAYISSRDQGIVTCLATTYTEEEFASVYIPEYITIDGKSYQVTGEENITVFGNEKFYETGSISVENNSKSLSGPSSAELEGNTGTFYLRISDSEDAYETLNTGYEAVYRESLPENLLCVDISLVDRKTGVPITRMGNQTLRITVTLPDTLAKGSLRILTADRNGQLENVSYTKDGNRVTFDTTHLSSFAFCNVGRDSIYAEGDVSGGNAVLSGGRMDDSPDTGDSVHPKWFLAAGLASMALALLFVRKKK